MNFIFIFFIYFLILFISKSSSNKDVAEYALPNGCYANGCYLPVGCYFNNTPDGILIKIITILVLKIKGHYSFILPQGKSEITSQLGYFYQPLELSVRNRNSSYLVTTIVTYYSTTGYNHWLLTS